MEKGFIKLHRSILEWGWWGDINTSRLFIYMLIKANTVDKNWRGIDVERGSFITSRATLSADTGLTDQQIRTALNHLQTTNEITIKSTNKTTKITVTNYDKYQQSAFVNQPAEQPTSNQQNNQQLTSKTSSNQPANNQYEEVKEEKKEEKKKEDTKVSSKKEKVFVKPTVEEVREYCRQRGNHVDADKFWNYYESNGWKVGKNPMKDWKAAVRTWERNDTDVAKEAAQLSVNFGERNYVERNEKYWQQ